MSHESLAAQGGNNVTTLVLLLTELMGFYAISSLLLIRRQLPMRYRCPPGSNAVSFAACRHNS